MIFRYSALKGKKYELNAKWSTSGFHGVKFNNLVMEPYWHPYISGNELHRALKIKKAKVKFDKN